MTDRNGKPVVPGTVVFEVGSTGSVPPMVVLADGVTLLSLPGAYADEFPSALLPLVAGETPNGATGAVGSYDLEVVDDPSVVDFDSYCRPL